MRGIPFWCSINRNDRNRRFLKTLGSQWTGSGLGGGTEGKGESHLRKILQRHAEQGTVLGLLGGGSRSLIVTHLSAERKDPTGEVTIDHIPLIDQGIRLAGLHIIKFLGTHGPVVVSPPEHIEGILVSGRRGDRTNTVCAGNPRVVIQIAGSKTKLQITSRHDLDVGVELCESFGTKRDLGSNAKAQPTDGNKG